MVQNHTNSLSERAKRAMREPPCITRKIYEIIKKVRIFCLCSDEEILCHHFLSDMAKKVDREELPQRRLQRRKRNTQGHSSSSFFSSPTPRASPQPQPDLDKLCFCSTRGLSCPEWWSLRQRSKPLSIIMLHDCNSVIHLNVLQKMFFSKKFGFS